MVLLWYNRSVRKYDTVTDLNDGVSSSGILWNRFHSNKTA
jgi:hypothetical protein